MSHTPSFSLTECTITGCALTLDSERVDRCRQDSCDDDPEELEPIKERDTNELWLIIVVKGRPEQNDKGDE
jgi:hypothetical protein